jgi:hypothetical protein
MTERPDDPALSAGRPITTGEFRAAPDISASTAQFRAFAEASAEPGRPWEMGAPGRSVGRMVALIIAVAVVLVLIAVLVVKVA